MFQHGSTVLEGPVTRNRPCWREACAFLSLESEPRDFRADLVARIRREIAEGVYETPERLEGALERLLDRLEAEDESQTR